MEHAQLKLKKCICVCVFYVYVYVNLISFPLQQWLHERTLTLPYTFTPVLLVNVDVFCDIYTSWAICLGEQ